MLATLVLPLLLAQAAPAPGGELPDRPRSPERPGSLAPVGVGVDDAPYTPAQPGADGPGADAPAREPSREEPARGEAGEVVGSLPPPRLEPVRPVLLSLLSGESLGGRSAFLGWAGWSAFGAQYAQGVSEQDDLGALVELDWAKTELRLGATWRRALGPAGPFQAAGRLGLSWYAGLGSDWVYGRNHEDRGVELAPGLSLSTAGVGGVISLLADAPITVTTRGDAGVLFTPRAAVAYETVLDGEFTIGGRVGVGWRRGVGDAPLGRGRAELQLLVLAGWQIL